MRVNIYFDKQINVFEKHQKLVFHVGKFYRCFLDKIDLESSLGEAIKGKVVVKSSKDDKIKISLDVDALQERNIERDVIEEKVTECIFDAIYSNLKNLFTQRHVYFVSQKLGFSLLGTHYFGIIDRGTNLLQIRPVTGCPLNCIYCSVDEGKISKTRHIDYMVDERFLVEETKKLVEYKKNSDIEAHIDGEGEPLIYPFILKLIKDLKDCNQIEVVSLQSNGVILTYKFIDDLINAGLDRINVSINSIDKEIGRLMVGVKGYDPTRILEIVKYANEQGLGVLIAPVWVHGLNDKEIEKIILFVKRNKIENKKGWPVLGIQNYEIYKYGRKVKNYKFIPFSHFYKQLRALEKSLEIRPLILSKAHFNIHKSQAPPKVFKKNEIITAKVVLPGRKKNEVIGFARGRLIEISGVYKNKTHIKVKITSVKDTINKGIAI